MKRMLPKMLVLLALLFACQLALAQRQISGRVTDASSGEGFPGVNIVEIGTSNGTVSDAQGNFNLTVGPNARLSFSFIGFLTKEVVVGNQASLNVSLDLDVTELQEIVVTGYATQSKKDLTGSVAVVKPRELTAVPVGNVSNQLQGRVAGVTVTGSGQPGATSKVRIRGFSSFQNNDPLYVVDGVPTQDISTLNPNDVESISVLKDAGAASIYGSRASNGVVVVTTKKGSEGVKVNYSMYAGTQDPGKGPKNLLNTQGYADLQWLVYKNDGNPNETHPIYGPSTASTPTIPSWAGDTNWFDEITNPAAITNHDLSLSGGNKSAKYLASLNYFNQQGIVITTFSKRFSGRFNSEFNIKDRVTVGENLQVTHRSGRGITNLDEGNAISGVYRNQPIIPVFMTQSINGLSHNFVPGDYGGTGIVARLGNSSNTVADLTRDKDDFGFDVRLLGNLFADVKITDGLNFRSTFGGTFQNGYYSDYTFATYERSENVATAALQEGAYYNSDWVWTNTLTFSKKFDVHSINAVAGYEALKYGVGRGVFGRRGGYFSDAVSFRTLDNGATIINASSYYNTPTTLVSQFVRADYAYNDKYLLSATVRRDGSSRFGVDNRYGVFPSVTAGWRISEESFLAGNGFITDLKIRGGYGTMGNQLAVSPQNAFFLYGGSASTSNYDLSGSGTSSLQGFRPTRIGNPDAKWETNITTNVGFDAGLLNNKLEIVFDWYQKITDDLLFNPELPGTAGAADPPYINVAKMKNSGLDMQLIFRDQLSSDLKFEANLTFTTYKNEIVKIAEGVEYFDDGGSRIGTFSRNQEGNPVSGFYGYQVQGLFQSASEVSSAPTQTGAEPGFFRFRDLNGDGVIDPDDRTFIGNPNPKFTYGLNLSVNYKAFDITAFIYGSSGNDIFNYTKWWTDFWPSFQGQKSTDLLNNSWTAERTSGTVPKASNKSNFSTNAESNSYYIEDGSYTRLKNLQIGYNIPKSTIEKIGLSSARIYLQGVNLFTITKYSGLDPEIGSASGNDDRAFGIDYGNYPLVKQYLIGVNIGL